jgi:brefeldin A-resistance guanine nucleotide exchange factor 1
MREYLLTQCLRSSTTEWNLIFALFSATIQQEEAAKLSFELMRQLASGKLGVGLTSDNYASFLQVLSGFANVGTSTVKPAERARCVQSSSRSSSAVLMII